MYGRRMNRAFASDALILQLNKSKTTIVEPEYQNVLRHVEFPVHWGEQINFLSGWGLVFCCFYPWHF